MRRSVSILVFAFLLSNCAWSQAPAQPNLDAQRAAMKKVSFLAGKWSGEGRMLRPAGPIDFLQTENAHYELDGLLLVIEGVGKSKSDGKPLLQALGIMSFDDASGTYHMRAFNDGRWLETDVKLTAEKELSWGFSIGEYRTHSVLRISEKGEWTESHEIARGSEPPRKLMEITVRPQR